MMSALPLASARLSKLWILCLNNVLDGDLCKNAFYFHILSFLLSSSMILSDVWFYLHRSFKHSKWWRHELGHNRIFNTNLIYSCVNFVINTDETLAIMAGFNTILIQLVIVAYFFGPHCIQIQDLFWQGGLRNFGTNTDAPVDPWQNFWKGCGTPLAGSLKRLQN